MKAMILAAGRGKRMGELTNKIPKPLAKVNEYTLIEHNLKKLKAAGITKIVINVSWLGNMIIEKLGDGSMYGMKIEYSNEGENLLGTAGGVRNVLDFFENKKFWLINSDIFSNFKIRNLQLKSKKLGHLILVKNPPHHLKGDFCLSNDGNIFINSVKPKYTFSGISLLSPKIFDESNKKFSALEDVLNEKAKLNQLSGELYKGFWIDVGTQKD